jgi:ATP-binding cassette, subfamily B, bacterial
VSVFFDLEGEAYDREYGDRELLKRIISYFAPLARQVLLVGFLIAAIAGLDSLQPILVARGLDILVKSPDLAVIAGLSGIVLLLGGVSWLGNWQRRRLVARIIGDVVLALRRDAFRASVLHDLSFFDKFSSGRIISRITSDTNQFSEVALLITDLISEVLQIIILFIVLLNTSWQLSLLALAFTPLVILFALAFRRIARLTTRAGFRVLAEVNSAIQEAVTGISVAKNFRQEAAIYRDFDKVNRQSYAVNLRRGFVLATVFPALNGLAVLGTAALVYWGGLAAAAGSISLGSWYLFLVSVDRFWFPMINIASFWSQFQGGLAAAERVFALIDAETTVRQIAQLPTPRLKGEITFDHVGFRYSPQEQVLEDFSLHISPGESVALVGHTGAGKSSIAKLIARFYEFQQGRIEVDGQDIRTFNLGEYRRQLGLVSQTPFIFSGTVAENIRYARPELSDAAIAEIARRIGGGEWLDTLPDGLKTDVGERGSHLSMGQRQLVALMRVLAQAPAIFVLDEATASIDPFTEVQIQQAMELILKQSTSLLIAHRLSTVRNVDRIIVLREGRIIEEGNHDSLLARGGHYAELYDTYFRHQSLAYLEQVGVRRRKSGS